ncbi:uncharacterized protein Dere_GG26801 [Drosophila erecta]|nr:uncharacterized protein Dere_GG26801 [Drosophila erecta]
MAWNVPVSPTVARLSAKSKRESRLFATANNSNWRGSEREKRPMEDWEMERRTTVGAVSKYAIRRGATLATRMMANFGSLVCIADCNYSSFKLRTATGTKINGKYSEKALAEQLE